MTPLTDDELRSLAPLLGKMSAQAHRPITLPGLIDQWTAFVARVERGYDLTGYDYVNDLSARDLLYELVRAAPSGLREKLERGELATLDDRFRSATRELPAPIRLAGRDATAWWWRRAPHDLSGDLASDMLASERQQL